jgi:tetratricopeptide (TPR) repeat protein
LLLKAELSAQDARLKRLELQYVNNFSNSSQTVIDSVNLLIANAYLNEGNYKEAVLINEKVQENAQNINIKYFLAGKAEFLNENYEGSLSFFDAINKSQLTNQFTKEAMLLRILNHNHLLNLKLSQKELAEALLSSGADTIGLAAEYSNFQSPKLIDVRKVKRKSSILPGSGLYYAGETKKAWGSFFMNFLCLGYTGYSIYTKHYVTAVFTGLAQFMRFYNGGKRAGVKISVKKNREKYLTFVIQLDEFVQKKYFENVK